jgi:hypothetical protein
VKHDRAERKHERVARRIHGDAQVMCAELRFGKLRGNLPEVEVLFERYGVKAVVTWRHFIRVRVHCASR